MSCPGWEDLIGALGAAGGARRDASAASGAASVRAHLEAGCPSCTDRARIVRGLFADLAPGLLPEVPRRLIERAAALAEDDRPGPIPGVRELVGRPVAPTEAAGAAPALRGEGVARVHRLYRAGPYDLDLALLDSGALVGQVLGEPGEERVGEAVCILLGAKEAREVTIRPSGDFRFGDIATGTYALVVESERLRLLIREVDLREPGGD